MSSFQRAREALGLRLREIRRDARLPGRQLAAVHGWHPSKISKIEGGKQTPSEADIEAWAQACGQPELVGELIACLRTLEGQYVEFRRMFRQASGRTRKPSRKSRARASPSATSNASLSRDCSRHRNTPATD